VAFALFIILNAVLFVRPAEIVQPLEGLPIYELLILACFVAAGGRLLRQFSFESLTTRPVAVCVLGLLPAVALSHARHMRVDEALHGVIELGKTVAYFMLLISVVDTPHRLRTFLLFLLSFIAAATGLALLQWHGVIDIPSLESIQENDWDPQTGELTSFFRLCSTGIFNDPNDLSLILVVGILLSLYFLLDRGEGPRRVLWGLVMAVFGYALSLTRSRGGMLALVGAIGVLFYTRYGARKAVAIAVLTLPALIVFFGGRQTDIDLQDGTGQARIQLWSEGLVMLKSTPLFGIGMNHYVQEVGLVAHNSYIHCYTELGLLGGTLFVGAVYFALWPMHLLGKMQPHAGQEDAEPDAASKQLRALRPFLMASVAGYAIGLLSLSRAYVVPTYLLLGLAAAYVSIAGIEYPGLPRFERRLVIRLVGVSAAFVAAAYVFVRVAVHRS
jgi:hypothetical protein